MNTSRWFLASLPLLALSMPVNAALLNDTFEIGSPATVGDDAADPTDTAWASANTGGGGSVTLSVVNDVTLSSNAMQVVVVHGVAPAPVVPVAGNILSTISLDNTGDYIELTMKYRRSGAAAAGGLRLGFFDTTNAGYWANIGTPNSTASGTSRIQQGTAADTEIFNSAGDVGLTEATGLQNLATAVQNMLFRIERTSATALTLTASWTTPNVSGNPTSLVRVDTDLTGNTTSFSRVGLAYGASTTFLVDDILVTTNVPEPASLALMGLGGLLTLRRRKHA